MPPGTEDHDVLFQSPFKRGNDCGKKVEEILTEAIKCFNPLSSGAMTAGKNRVRQLNRVIYMFQSPFKRGNDCGTMFPCLVNV